MTQIKSFNEKDLDKILDDGFKNSKVFSKWFFSKTRFSNLNLTYKWSRSNNPWGTFTFEIKDIKSGEEIVHEFFEKVKDDNALDEKTRDALCNLYEKGSFTRTQIKKALHKIREEALGEKENADQTEEDQD